MEAELWDFTDTFNTSDFQSACSTSMSGDSLVNLVISRGLTSQKETWIKKPVRNNECSKHCHELQNRNLDKN